MADDLSDIWDPIDDTQKPRAQQLSCPKTPVLNQEQFNSTRDLAYDIQVDNLKYLNRHPEIRALIRVLFREIVKEKPDNIEDFFRNFFQRPVDVLENMIAEHIKDFSVLESRDSFKEKSDTHPGPATESLRTIVDTHRVTILYEVPPQKLHTPESLTSKKE